MRWFRRVVAPIMGLSLALAEPSSAQQILTNYVFTLSLAYHVSLPGDGGAGSKMSTATSLLKTFNASTCNPGDEVTCITLQAPIGPAPSFSYGNGVITSAEERDAVFAVPGNVKLIETIMFCSGPGTFNGCTQQQGVRNIILDDDVDGTTYAHEFGHAQGIADNNACPTYVMCSGFGCDSPRRNVVTPGEATIFMTPTNPFSIGQPCVVASPSAFNSFYVPQAGPYSSSALEGTNATTFFRGCPNNDGVGSYPSNARVKVVVRDVNNAPIPGVAASDVYLLFNGGTPAQGFIGLGADSIIANISFNLDPPCPDVRQVQADDPTNSEGVTYISFRGPGGATRNALRKWGHYDTKIPVYVSGVELQGKLTSGSGMGTYTLRLKSYDWEGGLTTVPNQGEAVGPTDFNGVVSSLNGATGPFEYWKDFDSQNGVDPADFNLVVAHITHNCITPSNP